MIYKPTERMRYNISGFRNYDPVTYNFTDMVEIERGTIMGGLEEFEYPGFKDRPVWVKVLHPTEGVLYVARSEVTRVKKK